MEKLIHSIPVQTVYRPLTQQAYEQGLCLRYSPARKKWLCGYGYNFKPSNLNVHYVEANDPVEALAFFVELLNK
jgi:hypothetical protein